MCKRSRMHENVTACIVALAAVSLMMRHLQTEFGEKAAQERAIHATTWCVGLMLWPFLWKHTVSTHMRNATLVGLAWPYFLFCIDTILLDSCEDATAGISIDAGTVNGLCFALSGLLSASSDPVHKRLFVVPVLLFVCVVLPQVHNRTGKTALAVRCAQKVAIACATGLLLTGLLFKPMSTTCDV